MKFNTMVQKLNEVADSKKGLYVVLIISLLIKLIPLVIMHNIAINRDGTQYIAAAQQFAQGHFMEGMAFHSMPFYPLIIAIVHFIFRDWLLSARLISIVSLVLTIFPLYMITRDLFNRKAAFWACAAFSLAPELNQMSMEVLRDPVFIFTLLWSVYFAQRAIRTKETVFFLVAAILSFVPILFRIEGVIFAPFYFMFLCTLFFVFAFNAQERMSYLKGGIIFAAYTLSVAMIVWIAFGTEITSFNKLGSVTREIQKITGFQVGRSYRILYEQLKLLEAKSIYPSGNQNFAEVARHFMPLIYMVGFVEVLVKNLFVFFLVPLIWGFRSKYSRTHLFLITFVGYYLFIIFYTYVERDFIQTRFLLTPAILLFPWIGLGIERIISKAIASSHAKIILVMCAVFLILMPIGEFAKTIAKEDTVICQAGQWIQSQPAIQQSSFYVSDSRLAFYAGWKRKDYEKFERKYRKKVDKQGMTPEQFALENKIDIIALRISKKKIKSAPTFTSYKMIKSFKGRKNVVLIYGTPALYDTFDK